MLLEHSLVLINLIIPTITVSQRYSLCPEHSSRLRMSSNLICNASYLRKTSYYTWFLAALILVSFWSGSSSQQQRYRSAKSRSLRCQNECVSLRLYNRLNCCSTTTVSQTLLSASPSLRRKPHLKSSFCLAFNISHKVERRDSPWRLNCFPSALILMQRTSVPTNHAFIKRNALTSLSMPAHPAPRSTSPVFARQQPFRQS